MHPGPSPLTEEDQQAHADGQYGAGTERGQINGFGTAHLAPLAAEAIGAAALVALGGLGHAGAAVPAGRAPAWGRGAALQPGRLV